MRRERSIDTLIVFALALIAYANCLGNGFVFDDHTTLLANEAVVGPPSIGAAFSHDWFGAAHPRVDRTIGLLRPLVTLTFAVDFHLGGGRPWLPHLTNILLHALASVVFFRVFAQRLEHRGAALFAAGLFAVHALHTENVASIVGRADVIAFIALALLWDVHRRTAPWARLLGPVLLCAALLSKESAVLIGPLLFLRDVRDGEMSARQFAQRFAPLAVVVAGIAALRLHVFGHLQGFSIIARSNPLVGVALLPRELTALSLFGRAVSLLIAPLNLLPDYGRAVVQPLTSPDALCLLGAASLTALAVACVRWWRSGGVRHDAALWLIVYGVFLINAIIVHPAPFAERLWYVPSAGAIVLAGEAARWLSTRTRGRPLAILGVVILALSMLVTVRRNRDWRSDESLFADAVATDPRGVLALCNLGLVRYNQRRLREAEALYAECARRSPEYGLPHAYLAMIAATRGQDALAEARFHDMARREPEQPGIWVNYAIFLASRGRRQEALQWLAQLRAHDLWTPEAERVERDLAGSSSGPAPR